METGKSILIYKSNGHLLSRVKGVSLVHAVKSIYYLVPNGVESVWYGLKRPEAAFLQPFNEIPGGRSEH